MTEVEEGHPAAAGSALESLRERRQRAEKVLFIDLVVPRMEPPVWVRFAPVPMPRIKAINKKYELSKDLAVDVIINAVILTHACKGVFEVVDGVERSIDPQATEWPLFDARLAELLDLPAGSTPVDVVRGLYLTDGDLMGTSIKLQDFSGYKSNDLERDFEGN